MNLTATCVEVDSNAHVLQSGALHWCLGLQLSNDGLILRIVLQGIPNSHNSPFSKRKAKGRQARARQEHMQDVSI
jgi:hypothetical protein